MHPYRQVRLHRFSSFFHVLVVLSSWRWRDRCSQRSGVVHQEADRVFVFSRRIIGTAVIEDPISPDSSWGFSNGKRNSSSLMWREPNLKEWNALMHINSSWAWIKLHMITGRGQDEHRRNHPKGKPSHALSMNFATSHQSRLPQLIRTDCHMQSGMMLSPSQGIEQFLITCLYAKQYCLSVLCFSNVMVGPPLLFGPHLSCGRTSNFL